jgi:hypothetical protein
LKSPQKQFGYSQPVSDTRFTGLCPDRDGRK